MPGAGIAWLDPRNGPVYLGMTMLVGFPVLFLSMLERDSCVMPWSSAILKSLWTGRRAWTIFYLESTAGIAATIGLTLGLSRLLGNVGDAILWTAPFDLVVLIFYARLLGRLGWCLESQWASETDSV